MNYNNMMNQTIQNLNLMRMVQHSSGNTPISEVPLGWWIALGIPMLVAIAILIVRIISLIRDF